DEGAGREDAGRCGARRHARAAEGSPGGLAPGLAEPAGTYRLERQADLAWPRRLPRIGEEEVRKIRTSPLVIPGWSAGPDPESRDSGFASRPGMTSKISRCLAPNRGTLPLRLKTLPASLQRQIRTLQITINSPIPACPRPTHRPSVRPWTVPPPRPRPRCGWRVGSR